MSIIHQVSAYPPDSISWLFENICTVPRRQRYLISPFSSVLSRTWHAVLARHAGVVKSSGHRWFQVSFVCYLIFDVRHNFFVWYNFERNIFDWNLDNSDKWLSEDALLIMCINVLLYAYFLELSAQHAFTGYFPFYWELCFWSSSSETPGC